MRKYYWYISAFLRKHGVLVGLSVLVAIFGFSLIIPTLASRLEPKKRIYIGVVGSYRNITDIPRSIQDQISVGLTSLTEDGSVKPAASTRWTVEDDGKTYRFIVNENLFWQDGKPLEPEDITYGFNDVERITTVHDVVFKLPDEYVPFTVTASQPLFRTITTPYLFFFKRETIIGLGQYRVIGYQQVGQRIQELVLDGKRDQLVYRFYLTESDATLAFKLGAIDQIADIGILPDFKDWTSIKTTPTFHPNRYVAVFFDLNKAKFAKNIRQALNYSLQKPTDETRAIGPINPLSWAYLEGGKTYDYDLDRALERIFSQIPEEPLTFELAVLPIHEELAESIKNQWESFGQVAAEKCQANRQIKDKQQCEKVKISVTIKITNFPDTTNFDALLITQETPPDPDQYYLWHSQQPTNFSHYKNTRIDSLLERGRQVTDRQQRKELYQEFQQFLLEDIPAIFIQHPYSYQVERL